MRDPARISRILRKLGTVWKSRPDLRFGQLLTGTFPGLGFYTEDSQLEESLDAQIRLLKGLPPKVPP